MVNRAFFLDRDGVINVDHGYISHPSQFDFISGVFDACRQIVHGGYQIIIVTNQSGIGRGYYSEEAFNALTHWMIDAFNKEGINIADVRYCPHHPVHGVNSYLKDCHCRKPNPGMIIKAANAHQIALNQSVLVGDKVSDMQAGERAGIPFLYKVGEDNGPSQDTHNWKQCHRLRDAVADFFSNQPQ
ncbi:D-glycero-beta-D-manno-heptose 1,7-bisphosphate 7-phosphatase [Alteromonas sp. 14N.309.X.WAT.G.H12]|uniref:D-glycero-beta-D-manno-heptose 1,7-bisphosphate 7-phosphatase n=1 Tax=Alteromonas sp. 14N.309.X.WAT.G.H12 TaxID=3120824 RepID=UPI002FCF490E